MKKILILLAATMLVFACGGNDKKETVEQKAAKFATELCEAEAAGDDDEVQKIEAKMEKWVSSLSEEEMMEAEAAFWAAVEKWEEENEEAYYDEGEEWDEEEWDDEEWGDDEEVWGDDEEAWGEDEWEDESAGVDVEAIAKKAAKYNERMLKALLKGDMDAVEEIQAEGDAWYNSLSYAEQEVVDEATEQWMEEHADELEELL